MDAYSETRNREIILIKDAMKKLKLSYFDLSEDFVHRAYVELMLEKLDFDNNETMIWPLKYNDLDEIFKNKAIEVGRKIDKVSFTAHDSGDISTVYLEPCEYEINDEFFNDTNICYILPVGVEVSGYSLCTAKCYIARIPVEV